MREKEKTGKVGEESSRMIIGCGGKGKRQEEEAQHFQVELDIVGRLLPSTTGRARLCEALILLHNCSNSMSTDY